MRVARLALILLVSATTQAQAAEPGANVKNPAEWAHVLPAEIDGVRSDELLDRQLSDLAQEMFAARSARLKQLQTPTDVVAHQRAMRQFLLDKLGPLPARTPLAARVCGRVMGDGFHVEKILFESQPHHTVAANLYLPAGTGPFPGVIVPCGHSPNGKAKDSYQQACILLARYGIAALCYDPIGQGERLQVERTAAGEQPGPTTEHNLAGIGCILLGGNVARYHVWDGIRALDYLASRSDIDPRRLGCTGNSGGGTLTSYLMAIDERIICAAPSCYLTSFERLFATIGPQDAEQNLHAQLAAGFDHAEFLLLTAPRPSLMCVAQRDYFDLQGARDTFAQAQRYYKQLGSADRVAIVETDQTHGFSAPLRKAMVQWMRHWLAGDERPVDETEVPALTDAQLQCTESGQVRDTPGERSVLDLNAEWGGRLKAARAQRWQNEPREKLLAEVRRLAGIRALSEIPPLHVQSIDLHTAERLTTERLVLHGPGHTALAAVLLTPEPADNQAYLFIHSQGKQAEPEEVWRPLVEAGHRVLLVDLLGTGETAVRGDLAHDPTMGPDERRFFSAYLLGKSLVGLWAENTLAVARQLRSSAGDENLQVHVLATGPVAIASLHAAALEPELIASVRLRHSLNSWESLLRMPHLGRHLASVVPAALGVYDLGDLAGCLPPNCLTIQQPLDKTTTLTR